MTINPENARSEETTVHSEDHTLIELLNLYKDSMDRTVLVDNKFVYMSGGAIALLVTFLGITQGVEQSFEWKLLFFLAVLSWLAAMTSIIGSTLDFERNHL